ncbi:MAG: HEAT repeat domain-containing protein [Bryobacterales bacterium]|nr:HEAT repeat domain-containing protein [Bryobacterales bacterium]
MLSKSPKKAGEPFRKRLHQFLLRPRVARVVVLFKVTVVQAAIVLLVFGVHQRYFSVRYREVPLSLAASFLAVQAALIVAQLLVSTAIKHRSSISGSDSDQVSPTIRKYLSAHLAGDNHYRELTTLSVWHRGDVQRCLTEFLGAVDGGSRFRLQELAVRLGLPWVWEKFARFGTTAQRRDAAYRLGLLGMQEYRRTVIGMLNDPAPHVQAAACRALLAIGRSGDADRVVRFVLDAPLLVRAILAPELRSYQSAARPVILETLSGLPMQDAELQTRSITALEMATAWQIALPLSSLNPALVHASAQLRAAAFRALAPLGSTPGVDLWIFAGLADPDLHVRSEAAAAARRIRLQSAIPALESLLSGESAKGRPLREACRALAAMGPTGWEVLEDRVQSTDRELASNALSALAAAQVGSAELLEVA